MRISVGTNYAEVQAVVGSFPDLKAVFYSKTGSDVTAGLFLFHSRDQYIDFSIGPSLVTETQFLIDYPAAINAQTSAAY